MTTELFLVVYYQYELLDTVAVDINGRGYEKKRGRWQCNKFGFGLRTILYDFEYGLGGTEIIHMDDELIPYYEQYMRSTHYQNFRVNIAAPYVPKLNICPPALNIPKSYHIPTII